MIRTVFGLFLAVALWGQSTPWAPYAFKQPFTGATATNQPAINQRSVSIFDFMTPAQITDVKARTHLIDCTAAFQAAIDSLQPIKIERGSYRINSTLYLPDQTTNQYVGTIITGCNSYQGGSYARGDCNIESYATNLFQSKTTAAGPTLPFVILNMSGLSFYSHTIRTSTAFNLIAFRDSWIHDCQFVYFNHVIQGVITGLTKFDHNFCVGGSNYAIGNAEIAATYTNSYSVDSYILYNYFNGDSSRSNVTHISNVGGSTQYVSYNFFDFAYRGIYANGVSYGYVVTNNVFDILYVGAEFSAARGCVISNNDFIKIGNGQQSYFATHPTTAARSLVFDNAGKTVTAAGYDWSGAQYFAGNTITFAGTASNNTTYTIATVGTTVLTLTTAPVTETAASGTASSATMFPTTGWTGVKLNTNNAGHSIIGNTFNLVDDEFTMAGSGFWDISEMGNQSIDNPGYTVKMSARSPLTGTYPIDDQYLDFRSKDHEVWTSMPVRFQQTFTGHKFYLFGVLCRNAGITGNHILYDYAGGTNFGGKTNLLTGIDMATANWSALSGVSYAGNIATVTTATGRIEGTIPTPLAIDAGQTARYILKIDCSARSAGTYTVQIKRTTAGTWYNPTSSSVTTFAQGWSGAADATGSNYYVFNADPTYTGASISINFASWTGVITGAQLYKVQ